MRTRNPEIDAIARTTGIIFPGALDFLPRYERKGANGDVAEYLGLDEAKVSLALDAFFGAMDAPNYGQQGPITQPDAGIPAFLTTLVDPKLIEVLLTPLMSEEIYGVTKKGDWTSQTDMFGMIELTGETSIYGDYNNDGMSNANVNWPQRQAILVQTHTRWGDLELDRMALARVDWAARLNISSANTLTRFMNLVNFFGFAGLQNFGGLNDPSLSAALTPALKAAGGTSWQNALPTEILADVQAMFAQLQTQSPGNTTRATRMKLAIDPTSDIYMANTNAYGMTAAEMIKKAFPGITVKTAPEYLSGTTYSAQLIVDEWFDGQRTCETAFTEKMRAHRIIPASSSFSQKKTSGGWGTIIYRPIGVSSMSGI
jgi:Uncharacterized protein conserved in bacteria (DUF2184)